MLLGKPHNIDCMLSHAHSWSAFTMLTASVSQSSTNMQTAGWSALFFASEKGHLEVVNLLLNAGADITLRNKVGRTRIQLFDVSYSHPQSRLMCTIMIFSY